jgi:hypothetical protein
MVIGFETENSSELKPCISVTYLKPVNVLYTLINVVKRGWSWTLESKHIGIPMCLEDDLSATCKVSITEWDLSDGLLTSHLKSQPFLKITFKVLIFQLIV